MTLTPACDICPHLRMGGEALQAMRISGQNNSSRLAVCRENAGSFMLSQREARTIMDHQIDTSGRRSGKQAKKPACRRKKLFHQASVLNPYAFQGYGG